MPRLTAGSEAFQLYAHHLEMIEGRIDHFYLDNLGLVTIAVGSLIDNGRRPLGREEIVANCRHLALRVMFAHRRSAVHASLQEIVTDWNRVKGGGQAQLRISDRDVTALRDHEINSRMNILHVNRTFIEQLDEFIQIAFIDVLYNPAGVALFGSATRVLWSQLDPASPQYNLDRALGTFEIVWRGRGGRNRVRYQRRHRLRMDWFETGIRRMHRPAPRVEVRRRDDPFPPCNSIGATPPPYSCSPDVADHFSTPSDPARRPL